MFRQGRERCRGRWVPNRVLLYAALLMIMGPMAANAGDAGPDSRLLSGRISEAALTPTQNWPLPPSGPPGLRDKTIVYIGEDLRNAGILGVGAGVREAAQSMGWQVRFFDMGTNDGRREAVFQRAFELRPDGVILGGGDALANAPFLKPFDNAGIPVIGWHVAPLPGPVDNTSIQLNVATDSIEVAKVAAHYVIAESRGGAGVVIFTDSRFAIAMKKADVMAEIIRDCKGCRLLEIVDLSLDRAGALMPGTTERLLAEHGESWQYSLAINDLYYDHAVAALVMNARKPDGPPANISAGDGSPSAFLRIRHASYQKATVPEPLIFHGWQLVDELNRILQGKPPSGFSTPPAVLTGENIRPRGDKIDLFDPENGYRDAYRKIWKRN